MIIVIYETSARRHFSRLLHYLRHERRRSECFVCANVPNTSSRIKVRTIFFETNIQVAEMAFCKADFIIIKSNYLQNGSRTSASKSSKKHSH
jgi:hypothetical protein